MSDDYKVGKGRPPRHSQFRKGVSGNPRGRPRALPRAEIPSQLGRDVRAIGRIRTPLKTPAGIRQVTMMEGFVWKIWMDAMAGKVTAQRLLLGLIKDALSDNMDTQPVLTQFDPFATGYAIDPDCPLDIQALIKSLAARSKKT
nr:DUF5681 domain-containing protein [Brevundimonas diminuta]